MNMAASLGLNSPTIEGRIVLTAENKTAEGFDAARKQLDEFAKEAAKVQTELNTHRRTVVRQQREHLKEAEKIGKTATEMFSKIAVAAAGAFAVVSETLEHFGDIYRELEQRAASRAITLRANTNITPESIRTSAVRIAREKHLKSTTDTEDLLTALVSRGVDKFQGERRLNTLLNASGFSRLPPEYIQGRVADAIRIGRPRMFANILGEIDPNYFGRAGSPERKMLTDQFGQYENRPQEAEAQFFQLLKQEEAKVKGFSEAWETYNKANESYNDKQRALEEIVDQQGKIVGPLYDRYNKAIQAVLDEFETWPKPIRDAVLATTALGKGVMELVKEFGSLAVELGVLWALMRRGAPVGAASAAAGTAATGAAVGATSRGLLRGALGTTLRAVGSVAGPAATAYGLFEGLSALNKAKGGDGSLRSIVQWLTGKDPDKIGAAPGGTGAYSQPMAWNGRNLMDPRLQMNRSKDDYLGRSYVLPSYGYDPSRYRGIVLPPGRQHGGSVQSGAPYIVGEAGREMFVPNADGSVAPIRGARDRLTVRQFNQSMSDATSGVRHFTDALQYATMQLQKMTANGGGMGGGPGGLGGDGESPGGIGSDTGGATRSSGSLKTHQQEAYTAFRELGYDDKSARIAVGNLSGESLANPANIHWDRSHTSQGIAQWDPHRAELIRRQFGKLPKDMTTAEQVRAMDWEMKSRYRGAYNDLTNPNLSDAQRMYGLVKKFENPADPGGQTPVRLRLMRGLDVKDAAGAGGAVVVQDSTPAPVRPEPFPPHRQRIPRPRPPLLRDPLNNLQTSNSLHLGRGAVDVNLKLDRQLAAAGPASVYHASNFDLGVNVDRTGHPFSRPGDPAFPPPPSYG